MKKNWNWLDVNQEERISPHLLCHDMALSSLFHAVITAAEAAWDMSCSVLLYNTLNKTLHTAAAPSLPEFYCQAIEGFTIGEGVGSCGTAAATKKVTIVEDIQSHPYWAPLTDLAEKANVSACWSTPILSNKQRVLGTFACYFATPQGPTPRQLEFMSAASVTLAVAIEQHQVQRVVAKLSYFDPLTGLQNRTAFRHNLQQLIDGRQPLALFFLDLDNFKEINDTLGHDIGDKLIQTLSQRFREVETEKISFARIGGDEFTIIYQLDNKEPIEIFAQRLIDIVNQPLECSANTIKIGTSLGVAFFPKDGDELSQLMKYADIAMYNAKENGRNCYSMFKIEMTYALLDRINLQKELRTASEQDQFEVFYQPQVDALTNRLVSIEALLRWNHPTKGLLNADYFIEMIEANGFIKIIDLRALESSCIDLGRCESDFSLSVNLSASHLANKEFPDQVLDILLRSGFAAKRLVLQVSARILIQNASLVKPVMQRLRDMGIRFSIDDFGTCYSALKYLKELPIDAVKINKSFVKDLMTDRYDCEICRSLCAMAKNLDLHIVAEGVEQIEQQQALAQMGCNTLQGRYISYPLSLGEVVTYISEAR